MATATELCIGLLNIIMLYTFVISLHKQFGNKVTYLLTYYLLRTNPPPKKKKKKKGKHTYATCLAEITA